MFLGLVPLLLFNYVGFELQNGAAEEMQNPQRDVPVTVLQSGVITVLAYSIPVFGILAVLPSSQITGIGGFLDAVHTTFGVYGGAQNFLTDVMVLGFIFALVTSGAVWMMGSDRILAVAAYDGAFPGLLRALPRPAGDAGAGERDVGHRLDDLHAGRGGAPERLGQRGQHASRWCSIWPHPPPCSATC